MDAEVISQYCLHKKGVTESFPFDEHGLVFKVLGKMFGICALNRVPTQVNLKCNPERSIELRETYDGAITGAWHMNKTHWNTVILEEVPPKLVFELIDHSYDLVVQKMTKKQQAELHSL